MLDVIVHATPEEQTRFAAYEQAEEQEQLRGFTDTRFTNLAPVVRRGVNPALDCRDDAFLVFRGSLFKMGDDCFNTAALHIAKRFIEEMDARGWYDENLFLLGRAACAADDAGDCCGVMNAVCDNILSLYGKRLADARAVIDGMMEDLAENFDAAAVEHAARHIFCSLRRNSEHRLFLGMLLREGADHIFFHSCEHSGEDRHVVDDYLDTHGCDFYLVARETDTLADIHDRLTRIVTEVLTGEPG